jgi:hypothetical protein
MTCRIDHACLVTVKTGPSITNAAMGRVSEEITKVIAEGRYEKIFHQTFDVAPGKKTTDAAMDSVSVYLGHPMRWVHTIWVIQSLR